MVLTYRRHDDDGRRDRHFRWIGDNPPAIKNSNLERPNEKNVKEKLARINFFEILDKKQEKNPTKMGIKIQLNFQFNLKMTKLDLRHGEILNIFRAPLLNNHCLSCV